MSYLVGNLECILHRNVAHNLLVYLFQGPRPVSFNCTSVLEFCKRSYYHNFTKTKIPEKMKIQKLCT